MPKNVFPGGYRWCIISNTHFHDFLGSIFFGVAINHNLGLVTVTVGACPGRFLVLFVTPMKIEKLEACKLEEKYHLYHPGDTCLSIWGVQNVPLWGLLSPFHTVTYLGLFENGVPLKNHWSIITFSILRLPFCSVSPIFRPSCWFLASDLRLLENPPAFDDFPSSNPPVNSGFPSYLTILGLYSIKSPMKSS